MPLTPGVGVTGPVVPKFTSSAFPSHISAYGKGGWREVASLAERDALPIDFPDRCTEGMAVRVLADGGSTWTLNAPPWTGVDGDWTVLGGGSIPSGTAGQTLATDGVTAAFTSLVEVHTAASPNATGVDSVALNGSSTSGGLASCSEGGGRAWGFSSHAEGGGTAGGANSHAEGDQTYAAGLSSHAEGANTTAAGYRAHAEGRSCWVGPHGYFAPLTTVGGATVATISGTAAAAWFVADDAVSLVFITNTSGPTFATGNVVTSVASGGNTIITLDAVVTDGDSATVFVSYAVANGHAGGLYAIADLPAKFARSDGGFSVGVQNPIYGSGQHSTTSLSRLTTDATAAELLIGGGQVSWGGGVLAMRFLLPDAVTYGFEAAIVGRKSDGSAHAMFKRMGMVHRDSGTVALVGSVGTVGTDINAPGWSVAITADDTNKSLKLAVTGEAATTIYWQARLDCVEVGHARDQSSLATPIVA